VSGVSLLRLSGQEIAWRGEGRAGAPVVVLVHGILSDHRMWDAVAAQLKDDFSIVRYDLRGHGGSSAPSAPYTMKQLADDVAALLDGLGLGKVHLVGTSLAGMIGQQVAARHAQRLLSLTLANTGACGDGEDRAAGARRAPRFAADRPPGGHRAARGLRRGVARVRGRRPRLSCPLLQGHGLVACSRAEGGGLDLKCQEVLSRNRKPRHGQR
jgi:pimeloyl-ACP methyl ester carboxylesterase